MRRLMKEHLPLQRKMLVDPVPTTTTEAACSDTVEEVESSPRKAQLAEAEDSPIANPAKNHQNKPRHHQRASTHLQRRCCKF